MGRHRDHCIPKFHLVGALVGLLDVVEGSSEHPWYLLGAPGARGSAQVPWHGDIVALFIGFYNDFCNAEVRLNES